MIKYISLQYCATSLIIYLFEAYLLLEYKNVKIEKCFFYLVDYLPYISLYKNKILFTGNAFRGDHFEPESIDLP
jgi:hypothetical protein